MSEDWINLQKTQINFHARREREPHVVVEVAGASGYVFPLIAVHLYVFYFGLMADVTPPVGLASYAASAISKADPIKTGIQAFWYESRTAICLWFSYLTMNFYL